MYSYIHEMYVLIGCFPPSHAYDFCVSLVIYPLFPLSSPLFFPPVADRYPLASAAPFPDRSAFQSKPNPNKSKQFQTQSKHFSAFPFMLFRTFQTNPYTIPHISIHWSVWITQPIRRRGERAGGKRANQALEFEVTIWIMLIGSQALISIIFLAFYCAIRD